MDQNKTQEERILTAEDAGAGVIVSPDVHRANRVPPGQTRTKKWPILDANGAPPISLEHWKFELRGLVAHPMEWNWREFQEIERVKVFSDFHCVTHWSRLGN
ncbi:MAG TPA: molybdopterin-dependent oxidoreductase, partial [Candidatus Acidoferrum sp.]